MFDAATRHDLYVSTEWLPLYKGAMLIITITNTISGVLGAYMIVRKSPYTIRTYRWLILNIVIWCYVHDLFISVIFEPLYLFPVFGACTTGLLKFFPIIWENGLAWPILNQLLGMCGMSLFFAFLYRYITLLGRQELLDNPFYLSIVAAFHIGYAMPAAVWAYVMAPNVYQSREEIRRAHNEIYTYFNNHACMMFGLVAFPAKVYGMVALGLVLIAIFAMVFILNRTSRLMTSKRNNMSPQTLKMHKNFHHALVLQAVVPGAILACSYMVMGLIALLEIRDGAQPISMLCMVTTSMHTTINVAVMIAFTKPYKKALAHLLSVTSFSFFPPPVVQRNGQTITAVLPPTSTVKTSVSGCCFQKHVVRIFARVDEFA